MAEAVWVQGLPGTSSTEQGNESEMPCLSDPFWAVNMLGEHGVRSGQTLTAVARGIIGKMGL